MSNNNLIDIYSTQSEDTLNSLSNRIIKEKSDCFWILNKINFVLKNKKKENISDKDRPCKWACWWDCWSLCKNILR